MAIEVISEIVAQNNGKFPVVDSNNVRGGIFSVNTIVERNNIPSKKMKEGMLCYVKETGETYQSRPLGNGWEWTLFQSGDGGGDGIGIPVLDKAKLDSLSYTPKKYISIPNAQSDLRASNTSREILKDGTYVDILFSAIRQLQSEVARLRNSFKYGIFSYTDDETVMSRTVGDIKEIEKEPLWAIEEDELSKEFDLSLDSSTELRPLKGFKLGNGKYIDVTDSSVELSSDSIDSKYFCYFNSTGKNIKLDLESYAGTSGLLDLSKITNIPQAELYNFCVVFSRKVEDKGKNFIWISVNNGVETIAEGYLEDNTLRSTLYEIDDSWRVTKITFKNLRLYKCSCYTKYLDFSREVIGKVPEEEDYRYRAAHITIRSVKTKEVLDNIYKELPNNELIFVESTNSLYIISNGLIVNIGTGSGSNPTQPDTTMTTEQLKLNLERMGIVSGDNNELTLNNIEAITFKNQSTGEQYELNLDSTGSLHSHKISSESFSDRVAASGAKIQSDFRGTVAQLRILENNKFNKIQLNPDSNIDVGLYSDRIKIGAFYAPQSTDLEFGCSHAYIELENTADCDFSLNDCTLFWVHPNADSNYTIESLDLTGIIPAGGTYLIRGKKYTDEAFINVNTYDLEWYIGSELLDLTIDVTTSKGYGFALLYNPVDSSQRKFDSLEVTTRLFQANNGSNSNYPAKTYPYTYEAGFIDSIYYHHLIANDSGVGYWSAGFFTDAPNSIYKNTFELDPAKQAFQSLNTRDSSRCRWASAKKDFLVLSLFEEEISFPYSKDTYPVSNFTPKASFEYKNVGTDKTKFSRIRAEMLTCSFGNDMFTTRCFNWVSYGNRNEYLWVRNKTKGTDWLKFEPYTEVSEAVTPSTTFPRRKEYSKDINNVIYKKLQGHFPGINTPYTANKVVVELYKEDPKLSNIEVWEYTASIPDATKAAPKYKDNIQTFNMYPNTYVPRVYQITDQQGFHWVEYQVWAAAANIVYDKIKADMTSEKIIPVLINTGDMTQNGTRVNEWLDYYNAGKKLFSEFEQMNVVGNNDLCNTDPSILGTGDDVGKSNSYYFHVFYCYDTNPDIFVPIARGKYIPSLYYFGTSTHKFMMVNSEITHKNCVDWFGLVDGNVGVNIYTGYKIQAAREYSSLTDFTPIYEMLYKFLNTYKENKIIAVCHEMPFTVITQDNLENEYKNQSRSVSGKSLVGSHLNQIDYIETTTTTGAGTYWFSRLLEYFGVKLCIGGHKHTYAITYPVAEYFTWDNGAKNSRTDVYTMPASLKDDNVSFMQDTTNLSKFPLTLRSKFLEEAGVAIPNSIILPYTQVDSLTNGVVYFMCQATGFKLASNKELPSIYQTYSRLLPQTIRDEGKKKDTPSKLLLHPMFGIITFNGLGIACKLARINGLLVGEVFNQTTYSTDTPTISYLKEGTTRYGDWVNNEQTVITIQ